MNRCRYAGPDSPRLLDTHLRDCYLSGCAGCEPCLERHCRAEGCPGRHLGDYEPLVCARCVGYVRDNLGDIVEMHQLMMGEVTFRGVDSEAAMMAGPVAERDRYRRRVELAMAGAACSRGVKCPWHGEESTGELCPDVVAIDSDNRDELHPLWVLEWWDRMVCEHLGVERTLTVTVESAAAWLGKNLTDLARDGRFDFDGMAAEIRQCRGHMEDVLHDGIRVERGAPCPSCGGAKVEKRHDEVTDARGELVIDPATGLAMIDDFWLCPACHQWWTERDYRSKVEGVFVQVASALTASQIATTYRVPEGTVRRWASGDAPCVRKRGKDRHGLQLYDVEDVKAARKRQESARRELRITSL